MSKDPLLVTWKVESDSPARLRRLILELEPILRLDTSYCDRVITYPDARETIDEQRYELGDYFDRLCILPSSSGKSSSFRLFFQRKPQANRAWKDAMAWILRKASRGKEKIWIGLDYRVNNEQVYTVAADVPNWLSHLSVESRRFWIAGAAYLLDHPRFSFGDLERAFGIDESSQKTMLRSSYRTIRRGNLANPLWEMKDYALQSNVYTMEPAVRDAILCACGTGANPATFPSGLFAHESTQPYLRNVVT